MTTTKRFDFDDVPFIPAKHFRRGRIRPVQLIVIHTMEAPERIDTAENIARYFQRVGHPASCHYCVDSDSVVQSVFDSNTAYHCKNANANGVGIEHAGYANQTREQWMDSYSQSMLDISAQLGAYLCEKFKLSPVRAEFKSKTDSTVIRPGLTGHFDVPGHGSHYDPYREIRNSAGKVTGYDLDSFPWDWYLERVSFYLNERVK